MSREGKKRNICQILAMCLYNLPSSASVTVGICTNTCVLFYEGNLSKTIFLRIYIEAWRQTGGIVSM